MRINKQRTIIILCLSVLLAGIMLLLIFLDPDSAGRTLSKVLLPFWTFSIIPAFVFIYDWLKTKDFFSGFTFGLHIGLHIGLALIISILIAPYLMILFYINAFKKIS